MAVLCGGGGTDIPSPPWETDDWGGGGWKGGKAPPPTSLPSALQAHSSPLGKGASRGGCPKEELWRGKGQLWHCSIGSWGGGQWNGGVLVQAGAAMGLSQGLVLSLSS